MNPYFLMSGSLVLSFCSLSFPHWHSHSPSSPPSSLLLSSPPLLSPSLFLPSIIIHMIFFYFEVMWLFYYRINANKMTKMFFVLKFRPPHLERYKCIFVHTYIYACICVHTYIHTCTSHHFSINKHFFLRKVANKSIDKKFHPPYPENLRTYI